jgi:hypothetical protein
LERTHQFFRHGHVAHEDDAKPTSARSINHMLDALERFVGTFNLGDDADLHVIDDERHPVWSAVVTQSFTNLNAAVLLHVCALYPQRASNQSPIAFDFHFLNNDSAMFGLNNRLYGLERKKP